MNRFLGAAPCLVAVLWLSACGGADSDLSSTAAPSAEATGSPSTPSSAETVVQEWATVSDTSGLTFSLPSQVEPVARTQAGTDGRPLELRVYQTEEEEVGLTVTVAEGQDFTNYDAGAVYDGMVQQVTQGGAVDVQLSKVRPLAAATGKGVEATLTFQATDGSMNYWRMATLTDGSVLVNVQALTFVPQLDASTRRPVEDRFDQLVESLDLA